MRSLPVYHPNEGRPEPSSNKSLRCCCCKLKGLKPFSKTTIYMCTLGTACWLISVRGSWQSLSQIKFICLQPSPFFSFADTIDSTLLRLTFAANSELKKVLKEMLEHKKQLKIWNCILGWISICQSVRHMRWPSDRLRTGAIAQSILHQLKLQFCQRSFSFHSLSLFWDNLKSQVLSRLFEIVCKKYMNLVILDYKYCFETCGKHFALINF